MKGRRRCWQGVTIIEILVAMVLLATGVVFALAAISYATKATSGTTEATEATAYGRKILEMVLGNGSRAAIVNNVINPAYEPPAFRRLYSPDTGVMPPFSLQDFVLENDPVELRFFGESASRYEVQVRVTPYQDPVSGSLMEGLYNVDVQLRWRDRLGQRVGTFPGLYRQE